MPTQARQSKLFFKKEKQQKPESVTRLQYIGKMFYTSV